MEWKTHASQSGVDGLRLWVASSNYTLDVNVEPLRVLSRVHENVKKSFSHHEIFIGKFGRIFWILELENLPDSIVYNYPSFTILRKPSTKATRSTITQSCTNH